ncbi:hypothetical protein DRN73_08060 [Candidatus Pacearchaeota archaeon]|nr:MAG: hypothetical protein DRN73_08060 [Candidatus Pacearchaeota archaeon]
MDWKKAANNLKKMPDIGAEYEKALEGAKRSVDTIQKFDWEKNQDEIFSKGKHVVKRIAENPKLMKKLYDDARTNISKSSAAGASLGGSIGGAFAGVGAAPGAAIGSGIGVGAGLIETGWENRKDLKDKIWDD